MFLTGGELVRAADGEGTAGLSPSSSLVNTVGIWTVTYTAGPSGIEEGGALKIQFPKSWFMQPYPHVKAVQHDRPDKNHYVTAQASRKGVQEKVTIDDVLLDGQRDRESRVFVVSLEKGSLRAGDTLKLAFGDRAGGRNLGTNSASVAESDFVRVATDADGNGSFKEIAESPSVTLLPGPAAEVTVYAPSAVQIGKQVAVRIVLLDEYYNAAGASPAELKLTSTDAAAEFPRHLAITASDQGRARFTVIFNTPGFQQIRVEAVSGGRALTPAAAVMKCTAEQPEVGLYWGDMHSHSAWSWDGDGTHPFEYARDVACLDFYANTEHNNDPRGTTGGVTAEEWEQIRSKVRQFYDPGRFVTLLAFEATFGGNFGHHNVFYRDVEQAIYPLKEYDTLQKLWEVLEEKRAFMIPHHLGIRFVSTQRVETVSDYIPPILRWEDLKSSSIGGVAIDWQHRNEKLRRALEIYSLHGQSEMYDPNWGLSYERAGDTSGVSVPGPHYARDGWVTGQRMAVIASSDNHNSRPGLRHGGLAAVRAPQLTREAVWDAFYNKHIYGTTGERIWLEFSIDGRGMGQELEAQGKPEIRVAIAGTDDLNLVEIIKYDFRKKEYKTIHRVNPGSFAAELTYQDEDFISDSFYYVRARQKSPVRNLEVWAWSSPIWVQAYRQPAADPDGNYLALALLPGLVVIRWILSQRR